MALADYPASPMRSHGSDVRAWVALVDIGASGAATVTGAPGFTVVKNDTGIYDMTFPPVPANATSKPSLRVTVQKSATPTVSQATILAVNFQAGTAQFKTALNAAATGVEPASGDQLSIVLIANAVGVI